MKISILIAITFVFTNFSSAQTFANQSSITLENLTASIINTPTKTLVETKVEPNNLTIVKQLTSHLSETVEYPDIMLENQIEGTVWVKLMVSATGEILESHVIKSISMEFDREVLKAINSFIADTHQSGDDEGIKNVKIPVYFSLK
jgi:TonB family protein